MEETIIIDDSDFEHVARSYLLLESRFKAYRDYIKNPGEHPFRNYSGDTPQEFLTADGRVKWKKLYYAYR